VDFYRRTQGPTESFDTFLANLKRMAELAELTGKHCQDCKTACGDRHLLVKIVSGLADDELRRKLLALHPAPTLDRVIAMCRAEETSKTDARNASKGTQSINLVERGPAQGSDTGNDKSGKKSGNKGKAAQRNKEKKTVKEEKPSPRFCQFCGKPVAKCTCVKDTEVKKTNRVHRVRTIGKDGQPQLPVHIRTPKRNLGSFIVLADTGSDVCVAGPEFLRRSGLTQDDLSTTDDVLQTANSEEFNCLGTVEVTIAKGRQKTNAIVYVTPGVQGADFLLSYNSCIELGLLPKDWPNVGPE